MSTCFTQVDTSFNKLSEIIIYTNRFSDSSNYISQKTDRVSSREILFQNPQTTADLLQNSGNVYIQKSQQGGGSPMIRGFSANRLLISVDGIRMNNAIFRSGNLQNIVSIDPLSIQSTEILFGPGSVLYGSDAIGGVINIQTLEPQLSSKKADIITRYASSNHEKTIHTDLNIGYKKWAFLTSLSRYDFSNLKMGSHGSKDYLNTFYVDDDDEKRENKNPKTQKNSSYSQVNLLQKVLFKPNENWAFTYNISYATTSNFSRFDRLIQLESDNTTPRFSRFDYGPQRWLMNYLKATYTNYNSKFLDKANIYIAHQYFEESRISRGFQENIEKTRTEKVDAISINLDIRKKTSKKSVLYYGVEHVTNWVNSSAIAKNLSLNTTSDTDTRYPNSLWLSNAIYTNFKLRLNESMQLNSGIRYNFFHTHSDFDTSFFPLPFTESSLNNHGISGNLGYSYILKNRWKFSINFGSAFKAPNVDDIGKIFDSEPGSVVVPNPDLTTEKAYTVELAFNKTEGDFTFNLATYYTILQDAFSRQDFTLNGQDSVLFDGVLSNVQAIQNSSRAYVYGVESGIKWQLPFNMTFVSKFTIQEGKQKNNGSYTPLRHVSPYFGSSHIAYHYKKLQLELYSHYSLEKSFSNLADSEIAKNHLYAKDKNGNPYSPSWFTLNLKTQIQFNQNIKLNTGVENILNKRYRPYSSGLAAAGRNFIIALDIQLN